MAENKQYITQAQENGAIMISEDVIASIVAQALTDVEGVVGLSNKPGADIADFIGKKNWGRGLRIEIAEDEAVSIFCDIVVLYGHSVVAVAGNVQTAISSALEAVANLKIAAVNVNVCGIVRK